MTEAWLWYAAGTLWRGAVLMGLLCTAECFARRKLIFPGGRSFYLLLLILILLPVGMLPALPAVQLAAVPVKAPVPAMAVEWAEETVENLPEPAVEPVRRQRTRIRYWPSMAVLLMAGYGVMVLGLWAKQFRQLTVWLRRIRRCRAITGGRVLFRFEEAKRLVNLERAEIALLDGGNILPVPASFVWFRLRAVLCPLGALERYSDDELRMLLIHELGHLKHHDNPVRAFFQLMKAVLWFNPFFGILLNRLALTWELDCDALVHDTLKLNKDREYSYARLLCLFQCRLSGVGFTTGLGLSSGARALQIRMKEIVMRDQRRYGKMWLLAGIIATGSVVGLTPGRLAAASEKVAVPVVLPAAETAMIEEFMELDRLQPEQAMARWPEVRSAVIRAGKYRLARKYLPDLLAEYDALEKAAFTPENAAWFDGDQLQEKIDELYHVASGSGDLETGRAIRTRYQASCDAFQVPLERSNSIDCREAERLIAETSAKLQQAGYHLSFSPGVGAKRGRTVNWGEMDCWLLDGRLLAIDGQL